MTREEAYIGGQKLQTYVDVAKFAKGRTTIFNSELHVPPEKKKGIRVQELTDEMEKDYKDLVMCTIVQMTALSPNNIHYAVFVDTKLRNQSM